MADWYNPFSWDMSSDADRANTTRRGSLDQTGAAANTFAQGGQGDYGALGAEAAAQRDQLRQYAMGKDSLSAEQLRQGLGQQQSAQMSMAASARPEDAAMASRNAMSNMQQNAYGMSGQAAVAGIAERQAANQQLAQMIMQQRQQELQRALQSRQNAIGAYGGPQNDQSAAWKLGTGALQGGVTLGAAALSDRRAKTNVRDADDDADRAIAGLRAYAFEYKDQKYGTGKQVGVMAQDLENVGLKHTVRDTPIGKVVDGGKLSTANTAMIAALGRRVAKIEGRGK